MLPNSFSFRRFVMACLGCVAIPALAVGLYQGTVDLPSQVSPEGVVGDAIIKALAGRNANAPEEDSE